jgi:hypothetical protein
VITTATDGPISVYATDLDGDGDADVLSASHGDDKIAWYENLGGGAFGAQQVITTGATYAYGVYATDLDGDGDADVLSASTNDDKIAWYENLMDCNGNGISDSADIAAGTSLDCNGNGVPDECDILLPGADLNGNGIPDECETTLVSVTPDSGAWYDAHTLTLSGTNFDTALPAEVIFWSFSTPALGDAPLPATVVDANTITVNVPAGHPSGAGWQDVILRQGGVDTTLVEGWKSLPSLQPHLTGDATHGGVLDIVTESTAGGVVYLIDSTLPGAFLFPFNDMHFAFALDFASAKIVATGGLLVNPTFSWAFPGGMLPPGLSVFYQGLVVEFPPAGPVISFTEVSLLTIP